MGDRILILKERAHIAQYDTPETILTDPADEFVEDFIGSGPSLKRLSLSRVSDIEPAEWPLAHTTDNAQEVRNKIGQSGKEYVLVLDSADRPQRWVSIEDLEQGLSLEEAGRPTSAVVSDEASLYDTLDSMITSYKGSAVVVDDRGAYQGVVDFDTVLAAINSMRADGGRVREEV